MATDAFSELIHMGIFAEFREAANSGSGSTSGIKPRIGSYSGTGRREKNRREVSVGDGSP